MSVSTLEPRRRRHQAPEGIWGRTGWASTFPGRRRERGDAGSNRHDDSRVDRNRLRSLIFGRQPGHR
ncbi:hypothetical protein I551_6134 [Mycobacterium ulcerans str. Harvey]|uniref:Uncharacterized protein n=1 Tax=Mycobacterium ulcerans str. Harvey TaxID=1299332 RepID=A0ABP3AD47_MYCUL|nr:hypothetical protein I551_6134 [Mycobacterium ulcerans str. Harvey]